MCVELNDKEGRWRFFQFILIDSEERLHVLSTGQEGPVWLERYCFVFRRETAGLSLQSVKTSKLRPLSLDVSDVVLT